MFKNCFHFLKILSSNDQDLELDEREKLTAEDEKYCQRKYYDYCFPVDVWRHIIQYLTFFQLSNLSKVNNFFYSLCTPLIENYKINASHVLFKLEKDKLKINEKEISIKGLNCYKVEKLLKMELCNCNLFPTKELIFEQDPLLISIKWMDFWSYILLNIAPTLPYLTKIFLKNIHLSKSDFMYFLIYSKSIKYLSFKNVIFNEKINIGQDLYEKNLSLITIEIFMTPLLIFDRLAYKYALFYHPGKEKLEHCSAGFYYLSSTLPCENDQQHLLLRK